MDNDRIEREVVIEAAVERVWALVTEPGWWVNSEHPDGAEASEGATVVAEHEQHGRYPVRVEKVDSQRYIAYRWASTFPGEEPRDGNSTLVEFTLAPEGEGTRLRVVESGFAGLDAPEEARRKSLEGNTGGWEEQLADFERRAEKR